MPAALQVVSGQATIAAGPVFTAATAVTGDSFTIPTFAAGSEARFLRTWVNLPHVGRVRIRSPRLHDNSNAINLAAPATNETQLLGGPEMQRLYPADPLIVELLATAADVAEISMLQYFTDLPGIAAPLVSWAQIQNNITNLLGLPVVPTAAANGAAYGAGVALNSSVQVMKAGERYALLGYTCEDSFQSFAVVGPDTGNLRIGGPGITNTWDTSTWFVDLSNESGYPCIPVIQADNQGATQVSIVDSAGANAHQLSLILGEIPV